MTTTTTPISIDDDVAVLTEQLRALRSLGERADVTDDQIYDLSIRWGAALAGRLRRLAYYRVRGLLDESAEQTIQTLAAELGEVAGLVHRFGLAQPDLAGLSAEIHRAAAGPPSGAADSPDLRR